MRIKNIYFLGIGGIGMSAIARYFLHEGKCVAGYDRTETPLTRSLAAEGAAVHYEDDPANIPAGFRDPATTLVVYTPAIPADSPEKNWLMAKGFHIEKRSDMLGHITSGKYVMAVAGTHGKTSVTTLLAWLNYEASAGNGRSPDAGSEGGSAFLGGISRNFNSNLVLGEGRRIVAEADEFDRSFLKLDPDAAVITSTDADHLDIYGTHEGMKEAFVQFVGRIKPGGYAVLKQGIDIKPDNKEIHYYTYSLDGNSDFRAVNIRLDNDGLYSFDIICPDRTIADCKLGIPGLINVENAVAAVSLMWIAGFDEMKLKDALAGFRGVKRRLEVYINRPDKVYIDDYAHHPAELAAAITSIKQIYPGRKITAVFQPHLYTRTRDHSKGFGEVLSHADEVILLPIYPAREEPIEGINSGLICDHATVPCKVVEKDRLLDELSQRLTDVVVTFGAGDIDRFCEPVADLFSVKN